MLVNVIAHLLLSFLPSVLAVQRNDLLEYPEGYFPFEQSPMKNPPKVRKPPYTQSNVICKGALEIQEVAAQSLDNLCGNLNEGFLPLSPMKQNINGESYPFDLIKNSTLQFFSKTLPILREDKTLPKVAKYMNPREQLMHSMKTPVNIRRQKFTYTPLRSLHKRNRFTKRSTTDREQRNVYSSKDQTKEPVSFRESRDLLLSSGDIAENTKMQILKEHFDLTKAQEEGRSAKSFCENNWGILCLIYNAVTGRNKKPSNRLLRKQDTLRSNALADGTLRPLTPCPSTVEYVTPVFARNYQGVWRYVVQIPYEGYFTQTVEVTQCVDSKCHYLSGSCLSSPRWVSLLVAEIFYPDAIFPAVQPNFRQSSGSFKEGNLGRGSKRGSFEGRRGQVNEVIETPEHCDGIDEIGCFQVRLYYDWFLVSGSCKCWKQDFYAQFAVKT